MNKRIQELEEQCWEPKQYGPPWFNSKKFAELIVRECAYIARQCYTVRAVEAEDVAKHIEETFRS
jgi:hypothetical protein